MQAGAQSFHALSVCYSFLHAQGFHRTCQQLIVDSLDLTKDASALPRNAAQAQSLLDVLTDYHRLKREEAQRLVAMGNNREAAADHLQKTLAGIQELVADYTALRSSGWAGPGTEAESLPKALGPHRKRPRRDMSGSSNDTGRVFVSSAFGSAQHASRRAMFGVGQTSLGVRRDSGGSGLLRGWQGSPTSAPLSAGARSMDDRSAGGSGGGSPSSPLPPPGGGETVYSQLADMLLEGVESGGLGGLDLEEEGGSGQEEEMGDADVRADGEERSAGGVEEATGLGEANGDRAGAGGADSGSGEQPSSRSASSSKSSHPMHPSSVPPVTGGGGPRQRLLQGLEMNAGRMAELINHFRLEGRGAGNEELDTRDGGPQNSWKAGRGSSATGEQTRQGRGRGGGAASASSATGAARRKTRPKRK